jgi:putative ABC transport system permease protein
MAGTNLAFQITPTVAVGLVGLAVVVAFLAGSYPALFLSRFDPSAILRGSAQIAGRDRLVRGLLVLQFAVSVSLVGGALVMSNQIDRMQNDLGFRSDQVVRIQNTGGSSGGEPIYGPLRQRAAGLSGVERVGASAFPFFGGAALDAPVALGDTGSVAAQILPVDSTFLPTLGVDIASGRGFSAERPAGRTEVIVNEAFVEAMGWSDPVGREVAFTDASMIGRAMGSVTIIGVAENFHTRSMRHRIQPLVLASAAIVGGSPGVLYARLEGNQIGPTMDALRSAWSAVAPGRTFEYRFLDAVVDETYRAERRWRSVVRYAAGFALAIACFGLFGVAALSVARRRREIGVRKALGASTQSIVALFTKDLLLPMGIAVALALPLTYWGAQQWLRGFAYRIEVGPGLLLAAAGLVLGTALLAVGTQAWRAARVDPALTLREE